MGLKSRTYDVDSPGWVVFGFDGLEEGLGGIFWVLTSELSSGIDIQSLIMVVRSTKHSRSDYTHTLKPLSARMWT